MSPSTVTAADGVHRLTLAQANRASYDLNASDAAVALGKAVCRRQQPMGSDGFNVNRRVLTMRHERSRNRRFATTAAPTWQQENHGFRGRIDVDEIWGLPPWRGRKSWSFWVESGRDGIDVPGRGDGIQHRVRMPLGLEIRTPRICWRLRPVPTRCDQICIFDPAEADRARRPRSRRSRCQTNACGLGRAKFRFTFKPMRKISRTTNLAMNSKFPIPRFRSPSPRGA